MDRSDQQDQRHVIVCGLGRQQLQPQYLAPI